MSDVKRYRAAFAVYQIPHGTQAMVVLDSDYDALKDKHAHALAIERGKLEKADAENDGLTARVAELTKERDAAFAMSKCECESAEACRNLAALHAKVAELEENCRAYLASIAAHEADEAELVEINLTTERQRAYLKQRCADAELSLHAFDPSGTSEYWLKYSSPWQPDADGGSQT